MRKFNNLKRSIIRRIRGRRNNLTIKTKTQVTKIIIESKTNKALGVEYVTDRFTRRIFARKEVILSAGPKLLMLSGIGPAEELQQTNIQVIEDLAVRKNLQDHPDVVAVTLNLTNEQSMSGNYDRAKHDFTYWLSTHEGPTIDAGLFKTTTFMQTPSEKRPGVPDIQVAFLGDTIDRPYMPRSYYNRASMGLDLLCPKSRGEIRLNKTDSTFGAPLIYTNYLTHEDDVKTLMAGLKMARKVFDTESFKKAGFFDATLSGCENHEYDSDEYWRCVIRRYTSSSYHPVGTCKMGRFDGGR